MNVRDLRHDLLARPEPEQESRQRAVVALRRIVSGRLRARNLPAYEAEALPAYRAARASEPETREEIAQALFLSPGYRTWSALARASQEMIWLTVGEPVLRQQERIAEAAHRLGNGARQGAGGSLALDPAFEPVAEIADIDIHLQPGGYALERHGEDWLAGALYEAGGNIYAFGQGIGKADSKAGAVMRHLEQVRPGFAPARILEIGCSAGAASCAWALAFPEAEVQAVDIGAGMLRYAHARAEALGARVHFHQADAAALSRFEDGGFDLVVSHNLLHEIGRDKRRAMMREAHRLVAPGGLVVHQDVPTRFVEGEVAQVERAWDVRFNGEAFWSIYAGDDLLADMREAGFAPDRVAQLKLEKTDGRGGWYLLEGQAG
ncbi:class I SAM-dependent methyltransferase [Novosphingobium sp. YJ-S2-02]|uniref:Class I SAM-dependent methyltransferase n=1 Tax=Novosphingobium aureum TaxID=2792964 RepID=A0A931MMT0_9SPHN|nr:class I SAM-dependent methyltransferase [Novosphingobium aureum]MBH0114461.1 class I SAM-dependent methyltransferase [Novosphingobium aureum]